MKNKDKKILIRGFTLALIIMTIIYGLNFLSRMSVRNHRYEIVNYVSALPEDSVDIMIVGNSHAQEGLNADLISDILDSETINFSFSQQQTPTAYYFIKQNLEKQSPKVLMLEAYTLVQQYQGGGEFIPLTFDKIKFYSMLDEERSFMSCFFPITKNHNFWARKNMFSALQYNINAGSTAPKAVFDARVMSEKAVERHDTYDSYHFAKELREYRFKHLVEIKELCDKNDTELVLFMLPLYKTLVERMGYDEQYFNKIKDFCNDNDITYIDFNKQSDIDWDYIYFREQDYTHNTHLNAYGQYIASKEFAQTVSELSDDFNMQGYEETQVNIIDFIEDIDSTNSLLIVDHCPSTINSEINTKLYDFLEERGIKLKSPITEKDDDPQTYFISRDTVLYDYDLPDGVSYDDFAVSFYEIDESGNVVSQMAARWDFFDYGFIR